MSTQIRGSQIRLETLSRGHMDAAFAAELAAIESNITSIFDTMSTDQERLDAINAVTAAWAAGDATLQGTIEAMVNATRNGAGLEADGSYVPGVSNYLDGTTSLKQAIAALDTIIATITSANAAAISAETAAREAAIAQEVTDRLAAVAAEQAAREAAVAALDARLNSVEGNLGSAPMPFARFINRETPVGAVDGVNALFQLAYPQAPGSENVFLNGMLMEPGAGNDYTIDAQGAITLMRSPLVGDRIKVSYFR